MPMAARIRARSPVARRLVASALGITSAILAAATLAAASAQAASPLEAGAAATDVTPPPYTSASDAAFVPVCGTSPEQVAQLWPGPRRFAFEKPYVDVLGKGRWAPGDPFCDADHTHRYEAPYIAGGSGQNHWPTSVEAGNGPAARAIVFSAQGRRVALVAVDSIGLFNTTMDRIRAEVAQLDPSLSEVFVSSTHDESAPDPIGLWGPDGGDLPNHPETPAATSSGVDEYYMSFLVDRVAHAVVAADAARRRATLKVAVGAMPSNTQSCWSSYPYIDNQAMPVMQARDSGGRVIFTLADVSTHAETLAFSGVPSYISTLSADWPGAMRGAFESRWPGSVGVEVAGMVGSVETPSLYMPESTQVLRVPGPLHGVSGNPDGCSSVYPNPSSGTPVSDARAFVSAYGQSVADTAAAALSSSARTLAPGSVEGQSTAVCTRLENNLFVAAAGAGLLPDRPLYSDPACSVGVQTSAGPEATARPSSAGSSEGSSPVYLKTNVGVVTIGPIQLAYSPGEVFPFTELRGPIDEAQMPFPTNCYEPSTNNFSCGSPLPMTPWISAEMNRPYRFLVGLGEDMIGYLFPPGNFVGTQGETGTQPWFAYENSGQHGDRFGHGHADDAESPGPYAGLAVTDALQGMLAAAPGSSVQPGLYLDAEGHLSDSPFAAEGFTGAVGVEVVPASGPPQKLLLGKAARGWVTSDAQPDPGTAGTTLAYSVRTGGVILRGGRPLMVDVYAGARALGLH
jgi:hypothetical protein